MKLLVFGVSLADVKARAKCDTVRAEESYRMIRLRPFLPYPLLRALPARGNAQNLACRRARLSAINRLPSRDSKGAGPTALWDAAGYRRICSRWVPEDAYVADVAP